ncbi:MAG: hypothetical protein GX335_00595 [Firmicutes bacterium]|nr:hypothetical protein [Bacillota bacterium]
MSKDKSTATAARGTVRNWTEEEKDIVWEQACLAKEKNLPLTEAFRRVAGLLPHRSEAAVGMLYYNVLRKEREEPKKKDSKPVFSKTKVDNQLIAAFEGLPEYIQDLNTKIRRLEEQLLKPDPQAVVYALTQILGSHAQENELNQKLKELEAENKALQAANESLQTDLNTLKQAYNDALGIYDMFTNMASISQIMSLGDFKQQMKTTLDKWGNVLKITLDRSV